jgi:hypothetical protein
MVKPIPKKMRDEMNKDPFYRKCCIADKDCSGKIEWHHGLIYAGRRVGDKFSILPVCQNHHRLEKTRPVRDKLNRVMISRMTEADFKKYPKKNWEQLKNYLKL